MTDASERRRHLSLALLPLLLATRPDAVRGVRDGRDGWDTPVVQTEAGAVLGAVRSDHSGRPYLSFRGIPYAAPPVGRLRYQSPEAAPAWSGVRDARREGPACPQRDVLYGDLMRPRGFSEACLTLNVHAPAPAASAPLGGWAVLVLVHGGGFGFGSGDADLHGPEYVVSTGIILVTFNYRLGALGFLNLGSRHIPDNLGVRDMVAALRWVQRNVAEFGGDANAVTLAGQSAGASAAHLLALSPAARGLFSRCILMSGIAMRSWFSTSRANAARIADLLLSKLNVTRGDDAETARRLQRVSVERIVRATAEMQETEGLNTFGPVVELPGPGSEPPVVERDPYAATLGGQLADVPMLLGHTDRECHTFTRRFRALRLGEMLRALPTLAVPQSLLRESSDERNARHAAAVFRRYLSDNASDPETVFERFLRYCTEAYFVYPTLELAEAAARTNSAPVFLYEFTHDGRYSPIKSVVSGDFPGAGHIEDMTYLLRTNSFSGNVSEYPEDEQVMEWMTLLFTNFVKTGRPSGEAVKWPAYEARDEASLRLGPRLEVRRHHYSHVLPFFRRLHSGDDGADYSTTTTRSHLPH